MKTLIVYAKAGAGHHRAAEAVLSAFQRRGKIQDATLIDCLNYTTPWFKRFYPQTYLFLVRFLSPLWATIYYLFDNRFIYSLISPFRRWGNYLVSKKYAEFLKRENPKVIISTQFFGSEIAAALKRKRQIDSTLISVITDFGAHTFWESQDVDIFVVASEDTRNDLIARNIPEGKIKILGIPIEAPLKDFNKIQLKREMGFEKDVLTILVVGGGFGVGPIKELVFSLEELDEDIKERLQLIVVCSRNKKLYREMQGLAYKLKIETKIFGFVTDLYKMMAASNIIISKSGGLTTSEALAMGLPMIIISPIPGQESKNCSLLVKNGAAIRIDEPFDVVHAIEELIRKPDKLKKMQENALRLSRPNSADELVKLADNYMEDK